MRRASRRKTLVYRFTTLLSFFENKEAFVLTDLLIIVFCNARVIIQCNICSSRDLQLPGTNTKKIHSFMLTCKTGRFPNAF